MCGRFTLTTPVIDFATNLPDLTVEFNAEKRYNIAPSQDVAVILNDGRHTVVACRWGLIPSWARDAAIGNKLINARAETLSEKPSFRSSFRQRRCLILADGFYEWHTMGGKKTPHYFRMEPQRLFESPYTDHAPTGPDYVFPEAEVTAIVDTLRTIRRHAIPGEVA